MPEPPTQSRRELDTLSCETLDACIDVQRQLGHQCEETDYQRALELALAERGLRFRRKVRIPIPSHKPATSGRADFVIRHHAGEMLLEARARETILPEDVERSLVHLHHGNYPLCLLVNFGEKPIGVRRFIHATKDKGQG